MSLAVSNPLRSRLNLIAGHRYAVSIVRCLSVAVLFAMVTPPVRAQRVSPSEGQSVAHPEQLSGVWEASNGRDGAIGLHLEMMTTIPADAKTLAGARHSWHHFNVGIFERRGPVLVWGEESHFSDRDKSAQVTLEQGRLRLHFVSPWNDRMAADLDLILQPDGNWAGRFHREGFDEQVFLRRSVTPPHARPNPLVGTWQSTDKRECVHVVEHLDGGLSGWSDGLQFPELIIYSRRITRPPTLVELYGTMMKVQEVAPGAVLLELNAYSGICCPRSLAGKLAPDGQSIVSRGSMNIPDLIWKKMPADSCVTHPRP